MYFGAIPSPPSTIGATPPVLPDKLQVLLFGIDSAVAIPGDPHLDSVAILERPQLLQPLHRLQARRLHGRELEQEFPAVAVDPDVMQPAPFGARRPSGRRRANAPSGGPGGGDTAGGNRRSAEVERASPGVAYHLDLIGIELALRVLPPNRQGGHDRLVAALFEEGDHPRHVLLADPRLVSLDVHHDGRTQLARHLGHPVGAREMRARGEPGFGPEGLRGLEHLPAVGGDDHRRHPGGSLDPVPDVLDEILSRLAGEDLAGKTARLQPGRDHHHRPSGPGLRLGSRGGSPSMGGKRRHGWFCALHPDPPVRIKLPLGGGKTFDSKKPTAAQRTWKSPVTDPLYERTALNEHLNPKSQTNKHT